MSLPKYPRYKDSGVEWLGEVPDHWKITRVRHACECLDGRRIPLNAVERHERAGEVPYWGANNIVDYIDSYLFNEDLVLLGEDGAPFFDRSRPVAFFVQGPVWPNNHIHVLRPYEIGAGPFIMFSLNATDYSQFIDGSTRDKLTQSSMNEIPLPWPPQVERKMIVTFLNRETAKIEALISEQQRLIELLNEKRQAVTSHAVTRGLNPDAPMKPSGVEWLGDVPAHWDITALKRVATVRTGVAKGKDYGTRRTVTVPYLRVANVQDGYLNLTEVSTMEIPVEELDRYRLRSGDVLMNEGGDFDKLGRGHVWEGQIDPCITQNHVFAVRPEAVSSTWLNTITSSDYGQFYFMTRAKQSTNLASISSTNLMDLPVLLPPVAEQEEIQAFIRRQTVAFDSLIAEAERAIALLQECRSALISAAVTGKIDVRGLAQAEAA
ncbi:MAG TPA: restriction endonuclease subunit S [Longimicrobiaceae bacterium]|jgi:type I restriction enzyme S subunit